MDAITLFQRSWFFIDNPDTGLLLHEAVHRHQQKAEGWRFYPKYLWETIRHGYEGNAYEVEARIAEMGGR